MGEFALYIDKQGGHWLTGGLGGARNSFFYFDGSRYIGPLLTGAPGVNGPMAQDTQGGLWINSERGLARIYKGKLEIKFDLPAIFAGPLEIAPDVFLVLVTRTRGGVSGTDAVRISLKSGKWNQETVLTNAQQQPSSWEPDHTGHLLYRCPGGFCEFLIQDFIAWKPGDQISITHHAFARDEVPLITSSKDPFFTSFSTVIRDRLGCIWIRRSSDAAYKCPGDSHFVTLPPALATIGYTIFFEMSNGDVVIPNFKAMVWGRPGKFHIATQKGGLPAGGGPTEAKDGRIWLGAAHYFDPRQNIEYWAGGEGLDGNTWSITRAHGRMFTAAGDYIRILRADGTHWDNFASFPQVFYIMPGPTDTLLAASTTQGVAQFSADGRLLRRSDPQDVRFLAHTPDGRYWAQANELSELVFAGNRIILQSTGIAGGWCSRLDNRGRLWAANAKGFGLVEDGGRKWHLADGLSDRQALTFDNKGGAWLFGSSFSYFANPESNTPAQPVPTDTSDPAHFLECDRRGWIWRGESSGVFIADPKQARHGMWTRLDFLGYLSPGSDALNTNRNAFYEDADGSVWFGAGNIVFHYFPPDDLIHPRDPPLIFVSALSWNGGAPQIADWVDEIKHGYDVTVHIGSLQLDRRSSLHLRYRLNPGAAWQAQNGLDLHVGKLGWGRHTIEVQGQFGDGPWSTTQSKMITIGRPLWLSGPALLLWLFVSAGGGAVAYRESKIRSRRSKQELPSLVNWRLAALTPELSQLQGKVLDAKYRVDHMLARGGFAIVAQGRDLIHRRDCAVKIFRRELLENDWLTRRFQQEVQALERIQHKNVVEIYGHGLTPYGSPYLVMEFIDGQTLREVLAQSRLNLLKTASYIRQAGDALAEIHAHGICHRDLKPENFMIRPNGPSTRELVLIDFSIAIVQDPDQTMHGLSRAAGTLHYMAPEQSIGYADPATDIYSLAKVTIEMLMGSQLSILLPDASMDLPLQVQSLLIAAYPALPARAIELLSAALQFDPAHRPREARKFAEEIAMALEWLAFREEKSLRNKKLS